MSEMSGQESSVEDDTPEVTREMADHVGSEPAETTGHPDVDRVLATLDSLADLPGADQVSVFESAHGALRAALADAGTDQSG